MSVRFLSVCLLGLSTLASLAAESVFISEFMARNQSTLRDEDGAYSDWIELHNSGATDVNLDGWYLTDTTNNLTKWRIPATNILGNGYLIIFASGKDRSVPGAQLHTSFNLSGSGEYLALVRSNGVTIVSEFAPLFPEQFDDVSYGIGQSVTATKLVSSSASLKVSIPTDGSLGTNWTAVAFDDSGWIAGTNGVGFSSATNTGAGGLYAYWPIREGSGTVVSNLITGGANGTISGATWVAGDPVRGTVLSFNGSSAYVSAGNIPRLGQTTSNFTWSFWYQQNSAPSASAMILGNRSGGVQSPLQFIKFTPSNFEYYRGANIGFIPFTIPNGAWRHFCVVKNGSSLTYYTNGVQVGSSTAGGDIEANPFYFGGDPGAAEYANGLIDDVSLWTRALTLSQIQALVAGTSPVSLLGFSGLVGTDVKSQMLNSNATAYIRVPFVINESDAFNTLKLRIKYDDGFVAYINGREVARRNAPGATDWSSAATAEHPDSVAMQFEDIDLSAQIDALDYGTNILAIQGLNLSASDSDFLILPELEAAQVLSAGERYFGIPTPGAANNLGFIGYVADTKFSHDRGFYDTNFAVTITCATPGATIRYTTNGVPPTETTGVVYTAPIPITRTTTLRAAAYKPGYQPTDIDTQTYLFLTNILAQNGAGLPNNWGSDWQMDPRVTTNSAYAATIRDDMKSLPVVSIAMDPQAFWGGQGIYTLATSQGVAFERPCSAEMFFPDGSREGFQINCGIRIAGGASRSSLTPKHGIRLLFKTIYGDSKLRYQFFDDTDVDRFDSIAFRPNFNMSWVRTDNSGPLLNGNADGAERTHALYIRDQWTKD
ncbi:MAG TPA: LamG-like jellyroll fold domain-containing protein, partial [Candidatus Binatia bacterium]|nr:LamG-like jellyroll fold domain-containing protein [Candidatus Binatia bacterium]